MNDSCLNEHFDHAQGHIRMKTLRQYHGEHVTTLSLCAQASSVPGLSTVPPFPRRWPSVRGHVWQDGALGGLSWRGAGGIARHGAAWLAGCVRTDAGG